ncbi:PA3496 family putative envelope integrity protein [Pleionea litopenaei]|uniref:Uncharacterized protein n=1 Tax=Pleionea litopenaei TaxID=3070815 RepID=A0AA51X590_9GAMM|nr:hypothetical protein [Pleionea sp. HL-JVS1]WMS85732.1 hypothetical protein Q9312_10950 [Pleionea sp. HL-JVS1]
MQSSGRVSRSRANKHHWDDEDFRGKKAHKSHRSHHEVKRDLENYFERKRLKELTEDTWLQ